MDADHEFLCYNCKGLHPSSCTISDVMAFWVKESCRQRVALIVVHVAWNPALRQMVRHGWLCYKKPIALCSFKRKSINKPASQSITINKAAYGIFPLKVQILAGVKGSALEQAYSIRQDPIEIFENASCKASFQNCSKTARLSHITGTLLLLYYISLRCFCWFVGHFLNWIWWMK